MREIVRNGRTYQLADAQPIDPAASPARRIISRDEFMRRFTDAELQGIINAGRSQPAVQVFIERLKLGTGSVDLDSSFVAKSLGGLQARNLLTAERAAELTQ